MIRVRGLRFRYPRGDADALRGIDFEVARGEIFGFLGPSGAGKSTVQKILTGLMDGYGGEAEVFGARPAAAGSAFYERIGVGLELPAAYAKLTGRENLEFFGSLYRTQTEDPLRLLRAVGLEAAAEQRVGGYSKGMRMRLNLCRALLNRPELLFLDEPTTGQDPASARRIRELVRARRDAGGTVFLTTHDMTLAAELCDRVAFLVDGRIAAEGAPRALMLRHGEPTVRVERGSGGAREWPLDGLGWNDEFLAALRSGEVVGIRTLDATLEDVFIRVTGRGLA